MFSLTFPCPACLNALLRLPSLATSNFMNEFYNGRFALEFSVSMLYIYLSYINVI